MEKIKVSKQELLTIVKENRTKHKQEYLESIKAYRVKAADLLAQEIQKIVGGESFEIRFNLVKPESHEKEYDLTIKMLEMSVEEVVSITLYEFNQMVNDEWDWKYGFRSSYLSNRAYVGTHMISGTTGTSGAPGTTGSSGTSGYSYDITFADDEIGEEE